MKVIDLLVKIANGEEVPKKVKVLDMSLLPEYQIITWNEDLGLYEYSDGIEFDRTLDKHHLNCEVEIIEDTPKEEHLEKEDKTNYKDLLQQEIYNENKILLSRLESDTKLDIIKKYITSEEVIDNFKTIESRDEWLKVHDFILDIIDNFKLQNESGEVIEDTPKEDKKIEKIKLTNGGLTLHTIIDDNENDIPIGTVERTIIYTINEIIDKINGE